mgnify:CR=1 FL=1
MRSLDTQPTTRAQLKLVVVGHVDHGKSTLIGRLLHDTGALPPGKLEEIKATSARRGMPVEWSFALDSFQAERDQAITIDTTQIWFRTPTRDTVIIDAPGHREFLKNMVSGAAQADAAVLVVDAAEGVRDQSRRHAYLLHLLGLRQIAVVVNKMDLVGFSQERFAIISEEITSYLDRIGLSPKVIIPISAREGDYIASPSSRLDWFKGPTLVEAIDAFSPKSVSAQLPLRLPIQDVYKFDQRRILVGRIESGTLRVGDKLLFSPSNKTAQVRSIESFGDQPLPAEAKTGQSVGFTLSEQIFVERGELASHESMPPVLSTIFRATIFWLASHPLVTGQRLKLKLTTREVIVTVQSIDKVIDTETLAASAGSEVSRNAVAEITLRSQHIIALDDYQDNATTGRFSLVDGYDTVAGGLISMEGYPDQRPNLRKNPELYHVDHILSAEVRAARNGHYGAVLWFTGLSGAGKSTLAMRLEQVLFARGYQVYVLDGDNVRAGLNADLGYAPKDRAENIRRVGQVAALFADAGFVVITAFISPYQADRDHARKASPESFHEIHIKADVATCEKRDIKGLYKKARAGLIEDFTGISAPYEEPSRPNLTIDTKSESIDACLEELIAYVDGKIRDR